MSIVLPQHKTRNRLLLAIPFFVGCVLAQAAPLDGQWKGSLQCSALLTDPAKSPAFNVPIAMTVTGKTVTVIRDTEKVREEMKGNLGAGDGLALSGPGQFKSGSGPTWTTRLSGKFTGNQFAGKGGIYSAEGTKWRDCSAEFTQVVVAAPVEKPTQVPKHQPEKPVQVATNQPVPNTAPAPAITVPAQAVTPAATLPVPAAKPEPSPQPVQPSPPPAQAATTVAPAASPSQSMGLQLSCPLDWSALADIDSNDPNRVILGLKASEWKKEHVDQMVRQEEECQRLSRAPDSVKSAVMADVHRTSYPNALKAIERRDRRIQEEAERSKRAEEEKLRAEREAAERARVAETQRLSQAPPVTNRQSESETTNPLSNSLGLIVAAVIIFACMIVGLIWYVIHLRGANAKRPEAMREPRNAPQVSMPQTKPQETRNVSMAQPQPQAQPPLSPQQQAQPQPQQPPQQIQPQSQPQATQSSATPPPLPRSPVTPPPLPQSTIPNVMPETMMDAAKRDHARRLLIGKKAGYYLERWSRIERSQNKSSWNWMAFLFTAFWMAYRKMYLPASIYGGMLVLETVLHEILKYPNQVSKGVTLGMCVACGTMGNYLYQWHIDRKIDALFRLKPEYTDAELAQQGGASIGGPIVLAVAFVVFGTVALVILT